MRVLRGREGFGRRYGIDPTGLVLWLDQSDPRSYGDVGNWYDLSGKENHAVQATGDYQPTIVGADGLVGACRSFDGNDDYLEVPDDDSLSFISGGMSICIWMYPNDVTSGKGIVDKWNSAGNQEWALFFYSSRIYFALGDPSETALLGRYGPSSNIPTDEWSHVCATYDGGTSVGGIDIYADTVTIDTTDYIANTYLAMENKDDDVHIGKNNSAGAGEQYNGLIDEICIFSRALSAAERQRLYLAGKPRHGGL